MSSSIDIKAIVQEIVNCGELFRDRHKQPWLASRGAVRFTIPLDSRRSETRIVLGQLAPEIPPQSMDEVIRALARIALERPVRDVFIRCGHLGDILFVDLGNDSFCAVKITATGYEIIEKPPVHFRRPKGFLAMPLPSSDHGDLLDELLPVIPAMSRVEVVKLCGYLIGALNPTFPLPVLEIVGPQGSAKSTLAKIIRMIVDPNAAPSRRASREERDLFIAASNSWLTSLENLSVIPPWLSDALCTIGTGGSYATRRLYFDDEETIFTVRRPVMVNGIHEVILRPDLRDRALTIHLSPIDAKQRKKEQDVWVAFEEAQPRILAALFKCVGDALLMRQYVTPSELPRMADWFHFVFAAAEGGSAGFTSGEFITEYQNSHALAHQIAIDSSAIGRTLFNFVQDSGAWTGTLSALLRKLNRMVKARNRATDWPKTPEALRHALNRIAIDYEREGLFMEFDRGKTKKRERTVRLEFKGVV